MKKALINTVNNFILDVVSPANIYLDPFPDPKLKWVDCPDATNRATHIFDGSKFIELPRTMPVQVEQPITASQLRAALVALNGSITPGQINAAIAAATSTTAA